MPYRKTARAQAALAAHDRTLSLFERRVLILCDGRRDAGALRALLGADTAATLERLHHAGYLELSAAGCANACSAGADAIRHEPIPLLAGGEAGLLARHYRAARRTPAPLARAGSREGVKQSPTDAVPTGPLPTPPLHAGEGAGLPPPVPAARSAPRRSPAASRMYLLDMLQLQRDPEAAAHAEALRRSGDAEALPEAVGAALAYLRAAASPGVGARVAEHLREIAPESWLPALEAAVTGDARSAARAA